MFVIVAFTSFGSVGSCAKTLVVTKTDKNKQKIIANLFIEVKEAVAEGFSLPEVVEVENMEYILPHK